MEVRCDVVRLDGVEVLMDVFVLDLFVAAAFGCGCEDLRVLLR